MATLILKATEACNSNCVYCDVVQKERRGRHMPADVLETVFMRIGEFLTQRPQETMTVIWHGGEPLLLGPDYFRTALSLQEKYCQGQANRIEHAMQSNLTLFSEAFVEVFRKLGIDQIGTSFDPEPHVRGGGPDIDSDTYNRNFFRGYAIACRHHFGAGIIYVVTRKSLGRAREIFHFFTNLKLHGNVNFNPVLIYDEKRRDIAITPEAYVQFLGEIFPLWWEHRARYPHVEPFQSLVKNIIAGETSLGCVDSGACAFCHLNVAPDGEASHCGRSSDWGLLPYGHIRDKSLLDILSDEKRSLLMERNRVLSAGECEGCRFWDLCHGGCPLDAWSTHGDFMHKTEWCHAKKGFIERYFEPVTGVTYAPRQAGGPA